MVSGLSRKMLHSVTANSTQSTADVDTNLCHIISLSKCRINIEIKKKYIAVEKGDNSKFDVRKQEEN